MELSLTTFILEVINFLVLVWILKRLFFAPIKKTIETRRLEIKKSLDDADATRLAADQLRSQYENRLKDWERERASKFDVLRNELDFERERRLKEIGVDEVKERERLQVQEEKVREETKNRQERTAIAQSLSFISKLLGCFVSKDLETNIVSRFLASLEEDAHEKNWLSAESGITADQEITIHSAFPLSKEEQSRLLEKLTTDSTQRAQAKVSLDSRLLAGVEITIGSTVLRANLRDELEYFSRVGTDGT